MPRPDRRCAAHEVVGSQMMSHDDCSYPRVGQGRSPDQPIEAISAAILESRARSRSSVSVFDRETQPSTTSIPPGTIVHRVPSDDRSLPPLGARVKHYELLHQLGQGAMGIVYLARDTKLDRLVAIKLLRLRSGPSAERFLREAQATARCRHDNVVLVHEVDELHDHPYMVLEYLEGRTLREWMTQGASSTAAGPATDLGDARGRASGIMSPSHAVELMIPVVRALSCAHKLGIVHRDLKPENIFLTTSGRVVVLDFGIAKHVDGSPGAALTASAACGSGDPGAAAPQESTVFGTLLYMSPEQLRAQDVDARSDLWSTGIILFELVTGMHPLLSRSTFELFQLVDSEAPMPSVRDLCPGAGVLGAIIDRCLRKRPAERYQSADDLLVALCRYAPDR